MKAASLTYNDHFITVIKLLQATKANGDVAWRSAYKYLSFPEIKWTCLGYGVTSVSGSGSGGETTDQVIKTAKEIVDLGVNDPDLFVAMALFEENIGPDRIGDMATNVIFKDLLAFNVRILQRLDVPLAKFSLTLKNGAAYEAYLPANRHVKSSPPILLVPTDVLRDLPVAKDWSEIADAASKNAQLRRRVNTQIAELWTSRTLKDKDEVKRWALSGKTAFETFLSMIRCVVPTPYDLPGDPMGEVLWRKVAETLADQEPCELRHPPRLDLDGVANVVEQIIEQFSFLIQNRRFSEEMYYNNKPRPEKSAQRLFFAVAYAYCKANNVDVTPEADTGNGQVDFKVASGFLGRVMIEIKLSTNRNLIKGYSRQLETYKTAEETLKGYYVVVDVGKMGKKRKALLATRNIAVRNGESTSSISFIDASRKPSASKL